MKRVALSTLAAMIVAGTALYAEPSADFGVNDTTGPIYQRIKHTDSFGDTYYTYRQVKPSQGIEKEVHRHAKNFKSAPREIVVGLQETLLALDALQKHEKEKAIDHLKNADRLFTKALKAEPDLKLIPIDQQIVVFEFLGDSNDIKADIHTAIGLLKGYRTQTARDLLIPLKDEIDITTHYLPMDLYPAATKKALEALEKGDEKKALQHLLAATGTIVGEEVVVPIPLLTAQELVQAASKMGKSDKNAILQHLRAAKEELHKALLLGYTTRHAKEYKALYKQIKTIAEEVKAGHETGSLFEKIKKSFSELLNKTRHEKRHLSDSDSVWKGTAKAHAAAAREETEDRLRFEEEMEANVF